MAHWYISEVVDILTKNPEVWKKTIFILTYDENDGYFDHVPPFVAPHPTKRELALHQRIFIPVWIMSTNEDQQSIKIMQEKVRSVLVIACQW